MNYDENRISDLIDGGLKQQEESMKVIPMTDFVLEQKKATHFCIA